jgi:hypothetical protein
MKVAARSLPSSAKSLQSSWVRDPTSNGRELFLVHRCRLNPNTAGVGSALQESTVRARSETYPAKAKDGF